jgi:hypothetical protein
MPAANVTAAAVEDTEADTNFGILAASDVPGVTQLPLS